MTVYIEYVLVDNFFIDYMLLKLSNIIINEKTRKLRLIFSALIGAIFALFMPMIKLSVIPLAIIKILVTVLMIIVLNGYITFKKFLTAIAVFMALTFFCGGVVSAIFYFLEINSQSEISIALMMLPFSVSYALFKNVYKLIKQKKLEKNFMVSFSLSAFGIIAKGKGFIDSGNGAYNDLSPVVFCSEKFIMQFLKSKSFKLNSGLKINTINGESQNKYFICDEIVLYFEDNQNIYNTVTVCISKNLNDKSFDLLLHPALLGGINENKIVKSA